MIRSLVAALWLALLASPAFAQAPPAGKGVPVQVTKTGNYSVVANDVNSLIPFACSTPCTVTFPAITASWPKGYPVQIQSMGSAIVTIHPTSPSTIYGGMALTAGDVQLTASGNYAVLTADTANNWIGFGAQGSPSASTPGGSSGQAQWNSSGAFAGSSGLTLSATKLTSMSMGLGSDATGDIYYGGTGGALTRLPKGADGTVLQLASGLPSWVAPVAGGVVSSTTGQIPVYNDATHVTGSPNFTFLSGLLKLDTNTSQLLPSYGGGTQPLFQLVAPDTQTTRLGVLSFGAANGSAVSVMAAGGTAAAPTALASGAKIGVFNFQEYDGTALSNSAAFSATTTQLHTTANHGTKVIIATTPNNSIVVTDALTVDETQNITVAGQAGTGSRCIHADPTGKQSPTAGDCPALLRNLVAKTASYTILAADLGTSFTNAGATGAVTYTLPAAGGISVGFNVCFTVAAAFDLVVTAPAGVKIAIGEVNSSAAGSLTIGKGTGSTVPFAAQCIYEITATQWVSYSGTGSWSLS